MKLRTLHHGAPTGRPPLLVAHGLFGSARNWGAVAKRPGADRAVAAVDMRNHGASPWDDRHDYEAMAADLGEAVEAAGGAPHDVLGHSMGGKAAMVLALRRPELMRRLVVADIAPAAYGHSQLPLIEAMRGVDPAAVTRRSEAAAQLGSVPDDGTRAFLLQSLDVGEGRWTLNLDALAREMPRIMGFPEIEARFEGPTLFLAGGASDYVRAEHEPAIQRLFPAARIERIEGAGHWLHAEAPRPFEAAVRAFLDA